MTPFTSPTDEEKECGKKMAHEALTKSPTALLEDIHTDIIAWDDLVSPRRMQAAFATLLAILARQASEDTRKIARLTWALLILTVLLGVIALIQVVAMCRA